MHANAGQGLRGVPFHHEPIKMAFPRRHDPRVPSRPGNALGDGFGPQRLDVFNLNRLLNRLLLDELLGILS